MREFTLSLVAILLFTACSSQKMPEAEQSKQPEHGSNNPIEQETTSIPSFLVE